MIKTSQKRVLLSEISMTFALLLPLTAGAQTKENPGSPATAKPIAAVMKVLTVKDEKSLAGPAENFKGSVRVSRLIAGESPSALTAGSVTFEAGSRSNWHTHPMGQFLIVSEGTGRVQEWGKPVQKIKVGDVVWTPPNVKHWHGAAPDSAMTHLAVSETAKGTPVVWLEPVSDEEYKKPVP